MPSGQHRMVPHAAHDSDAESFEEPSESDSEPAGDLENDDVRRVSEHTAEVLNSSVATREDYQQAIKQLQLLNDQLRQDMRKLKLDNASHATASRSQAKDSTRLRHVSTIVEKIRSSGRKFGIMHEMFVPNDVFAYTVHGLPAVNGSTRAVDARTERIVKELQGFLTSELLSTLAENPTVFKKEFLHGLQDTRRTAIHNLRDSAPIVFGFAADEFMADFDRSHVAHFTELLKFPGETDIPLYIPAFFPDRVRNMHEVFHSEALARLLKAVLCGKASLTKVNYARPKTNAQLWAVVEATIGSIAWIAIVEKFLLSPDTVFSAIGHRSGINYEQDFNSLKTHLAVFSESNDTQFKTYVKSLLKFFNDIIFPAIVRQHHGNASTPVSNLDSLENIMREMSLGDQNSTSVASAPAPVGGTSIPNTDHTPPFASNEEPDEHEENTMEPAPAPPRRSRKGKAKATTTIAPRTRRR